MNLRYERGRVKNWVEARQVRVNDHSRLLENLPRFSSSFQRAHCTVKTIQPSHSFHSTRTSSFLPIVCACFPAQPVFFRARDANSRMLSPVERPKSNEGLIFSR